MSVEDHTADRVNERRKAKGVALRVFYYVVGAYLFLNVVGALGAYAQK
ncbi:hypothetical protein ACGFMM_23530 [Streptomyces sp. NPDC048604]